MPKPSAVDPLVSPAWLHDNLDSEEIQIVENAWVPESYLRAHIPGAVQVPSHPHLKHFDTAGEKTHHVMRAAEFNELCHALGLQKNRRCVVYDDSHGQHAARFRAVCRYYGFDNVSVLDGGWYGWVAGAHPVTADVTTPTAGSDLVATSGNDLFVGREELLRLLPAREVQIWDTRRPEEFNGVETRENPRCGHMPGALNLPWTELLTGDETEGTPRFAKPLPELARQLSELGLLPDHTIVTYCQSGIRASYCLLLLERLGYTHHRLYDGSMGEWANRTDTPLINPAN